MEEPKSTQQLRFVQPEGGVPSIYANNARVSLTYNDLKIYFADALAVEPGQQFMLGRGEAVENTNAMLMERVCMILSPEFTRALHDILGTAIEKYEEKFGKLRPAPGTAS
jgi:hypothetical protein